MMTADSSPPLAGVKVLDLTRHMAGPYATVFMSDYGADVIKVESLPHGDPSRATGAKHVSEVSGAYMLWNRGKRGVAVNLRSTEGVAVVAKLAETADIMIENYRPGVADEIGIGYSALAERNPALIYVSISAFGEGPLASYPGTDPVVQAMSGISSVTGPDDGPPMLVGVPIADFTGAMVACQAALLGLIARGRTGQGQRIEVSMLYALMSALTTRLASYWATGEEQTRYGGRHSLSMPFQIFEASDGHVVAGIWRGGDHLWPEFCEALRVPELGSDPRYATNAGRIARRAELEPILVKAFKEASCEEWEQRFRERSVLFGVVYTFGQILSHPHVVQSGILGHTQHPIAGQVPALGPVIKFSDTPGAIHGHAPMFGEHTTDVLREVGYGDEQIEALMESGVLGSADQESSFGY